MKNSNMAEVINPKSNLAVQMLIGTCRRVKIMPETDLNEFEQLLILREERSRYRGGNVLNAVEQERFDVLYSKAIAAVDNYNDTVVDDLDYSMFVPQMKRK